MIRIKKTFFESLSKFTKVVKSRKKFGFSPGHVSRTPEEWEAARSELYAELKRLVEAYIAAEDARKAYYKKTKGKKRDPSHHRVDLELDSCKNDLTVHWSRLEKQNLLPRNNSEAFQYTSWESFVVRVRRDPSIWRRIQPTSSVSRRSRVLIA